ncbi:FG-GAP-like repeat-containing protein [Candidatus Williamhamiltonella defendens]|uniref:Peptidase C80 domain-containing protein n=1 Tax=Candidatus Williamhamiltonella defendens TaxID=138072 RepID=A0A2D3TDC2_9ENTR|nr:FG-GAP-like repeat-containing protein [Candidatus Hamiltonella defensa]ATW33817.1 hypothetical protein BJP43_05525 [Candidatus Hamiltonella defensa]
MPSEKKISPQQKKRGLSKAALPDIKRIKTIDGEAGGRLKNNEVPEADPVKFELDQETRGKHVMVFSGFSKLGYDDEDTIKDKLLSVLREALKTYDADKLIIVSDGKEQGIGIVYKVAKSLYPLKIRTIGILPEEEAQFHQKSPYCDKVFYVKGSNKFADKYNETSEVLDQKGQSYRVYAGTQKESIQRTGEFLVFGGGPVSQSELDEAVALGKKIIKTRSYYRYFPSRKALKEWNLKNGKDDPNEWNQDAMKALMPLFTKKFDEKVSSRFDSQLIVPIGFDDVSLDAGVHLRNKHLNLNNVTVVIDPEGNDPYFPIDGDPNSLGDRVRWQLIGHGRVNELNHRDASKLESYSALDLAKRLILLAQSLNNYPGHINLVVCATASSGENNSHYGYVQKLGEGLDFWLKKQVTDSKDQLKRAIHLGQKNQVKLAKSLEEAQTQLARWHTVELAARRLEVSVSIEGRKVSVDRREGDGMDDKVVLGWNEEGQLVRKNPPPAAIAGITPLSNTSTPLNLQGRLSEVIKEQEPALKTVPVPNRSALLNRFSGRAVLGMQGYGYLRGLRDIKRVIERLQKNDLSQEEKDKLNAQLYWAIGSFTSNIGIDGTQYGLEQYGRRLMQKGSKAGSQLKLARFGGPLLGALSSGFDLFEAYQAFDELSKTTDPKIRQDAIVKGSLATAGAALGIGTAMAFAMGGTAAVAAGPAGLAVGGILLGTGEIYSAVRQVEELKKWVELTGSEEFESGVHAFIGIDFSPNIENKVQREKALDEGRQSHKQIQVKSAQNLMHIYPQIKRVHTSRGTVSVQPQRYQKITVNEGNIVVRSLSPDDVEVIPGIAVDRVRPENVAKETEALQNRLHPSATVTVVDSDYEYYQSCFDNNRDDKTDEDILITESAGHRQWLGRFVDENKKTLIHRQELKLRNRISAPTALGDFNGDGHLDIGYFSDNGLSFLFSDEKGAYSQVKTYKKADTFSTFYNAQYATNVRHLVGDVNGDGLDDILFFLNGVDPLQILLAQKTGGFLKTENQSVKLPSFSEAAPVLVDVDRDGYLDLVSFIKDKVYLHYGDPNTLFGSPHETGLSTLALESDENLRSSQYSHHLSGDLNGDGFGDILSVSQKGQLQILLGTGDRQTPFKRMGDQKHDFVKKLKGTFNPAQLQLQDINGDRRADFLVMQDDGSYTVSYGREDGYFDVPDETSSDRQHQPVADWPNRLPRHIGSMQPITAHDPKIIGLRHSSSPGVPPAVLSLNEAGEVYAHPLQSVPECDAINYYRLGDGDDEVAGQQNSRNRFDVGAGIKKFTGGPYADSFLLQGKPAPSEASHLNGKGLTDDEAQDDQDTVVGAVKTKDGQGYEINLKQSYVKYTVGHKLIATLSGIEHAVGHRETNDKLVGDDGNNQLDGAGGKDDLIGHGGNDILSLSAGRAVGGKGMDTYRILQNTTQENSTIEVEETSDSDNDSHIVLHYRLANLMKISLRETDVVLTLRNDNQTQTEVILKDLYSEVTQNGERQLQHRYIFQTSDGVFLKGFQNTLSQTEENDLLFQKSDSGPDDAVRIKNQEEFTIEPLAQAMGSFESLGSQPVEAQIEDLPSQFNLSMSKPGTCL